MRRSVPTQGMQQVELLNTRRAEAEVRPWCAYRSVNSVPVMLAAQSLCYSYLSHPHLSGNLLSCFTIKAAAVALFALFETPSAMNCPTR